MNGVPSDLPALRDFHGSVLVAVDDLENIVYFRFAHPQTDGEIEIGVEGAWRLRSPGGEIVAQGTPSVADQASLLPLEATVTASGTQPPDTAFLRFSTGHVLDFVDNSAQYESFCIPHADVYI
jgi:hypothetical protein